MRRGQTALLTVTTGSDCRVKCCQTLRRRMNPRDLTLRCSTTSKLTETFACRPCSCRTRRDYKIRGGYPTPYRYLKNLPCSQIFRQSTRLRHRIITMATEFERFLLLSECLSINTFARSNAFRRLHIGNIGAKL